jgi:hypothetical protein
MIRMTFGFRAKVDPAQTKNKRRRLEKIFIEELFEQEIKKNNRKELYRRT